MTFQTPPDFWAHHQELLGKEPDRDLATQIGVPISHVRAQREKLGISECRPKYAKPPHEWTDEMIAVLGTMSDSDAAKVLGGIDPQATRNRRSILGIPAFRSKRLIKKKVAENALYEAVSWPAELLPQLGTRYDIYLARKYNIPEWMIARKRKSAGRREAPFSHLYPFLNNKSC